KRNRDIEGQMAANVRNGAGARFIRSKRICIDGRRHDSIRWNKEELCEYNDSPDSSPVSHRRSESAKPGRRVEHQTLTRPHAALRSVSTLIVRFQRALVNSPFA